MAGWWLTYPIFPFAMLHRLGVRKNMSSSMGRMTSHALWKIKNDPNHQPASMTDHFATKIFSCSGFSIATFDY
jgi:phosphoketolase